MEGGGTSYGIQQYGVKKLHLISWHGIRNWRSWGARSLSIQQDPTRLMVMEIWNGQAYSLVEDDSGEVWNCGRGMEVYRHHTCICMHTLKEFDERIEIIGGIIFR